MPTAIYTAATRGMIDREVIAALKPSCIFVNIARGQLVDEAALIEALKANRIYGAGLDVAVVEPPDPASPLWTLPNVFVTPHTAGETRAYEDNVLDILMENLDRLWRGEKTLRNQVL